MLARQNEDPRQNISAMEAEARTLIDLYGDPIEAVMTLLHERDTMHRRLLLANYAMGHGFTRGWKA